MDEKYQEKARKILERASAERAQKQTATVSSLTDAQVSEYLASFRLIVIPRLHSAVTVAQAKVLKGVGQLDCSEATDRRWHCTFVPSSQTYRKSQMVVALDIDTGKVRVSMTLGRMYPTTEDLGPVGDIASAAVFSVVREFAIEAVNAA